jgi:hypothetical protein
MTGYLMRNIFYKNLTSELTEIKLTESGFSINEPFGAKPKLFDWKEINSVQFSENRNEVIFEKADKKIGLKNNNIGWYEFIQNVPTRFKEFDFYYVSEFMNSLKPCGVCGIVAVREDVCIVCETIIWNNEVVENEIEYIKSKQSELYSELIKDGIEIKKVAKPEHGFKADKNWKLYI